MLRAAWKSLLARKVRLLMSTFAIVLGVAFVAGSYVFTDTLSRSFTEVFAASAGDVVVRPAGATGDDGNPTTRSLPADLVDRLADVDGAARVDGNVTTFGVFVVGTDGKLVGAQGAPGLGGNYTGAPAGHGVAGLHITAGSAPDGPGEVAIDEATAERAGYALGDRVHLVTSSDRAVLHPRLVGIVQYGERGSTNGATFTLFDTATAQQLFLDGRDRFHDIWVTAADGVSQQELRDEVAAVLPSGVEAVTGDVASDEMASDLLEAISFISTFLLVFAGIALLVGSFLIVNTFSILVAQRSKELALLRALGASRGQVSRSVLFEAFMLGVAGASIGLGLGLLLAMGIRSLFATFGLDMSGTDLVFAPRTVLVSYAVGVLVTMVAAYLPARRSARIAPVAALRDDVAMPESALRRRTVLGAGLGVVGAVLGGTGLYADVAEPAWWIGGGALLLLLGTAAAAPVLSRPVLHAAAAAYHRVFGSVGRLAGQNTLRNPRRTAATASALMIGLTLVTTMSVLGASAKASVDKAIEQNFVGDLVVSNAIGVPFSPSVADRVEGVDGVAAVARLRHGVGQYDGHGQGITGVDPAALSRVVDLSLVEGDLDRVHTGTILVSQSLAEDDHIAVGDRIDYGMPVGMRHYEVVGIFEDNPVLGYPLVTTLDTLRKAGFEPADALLLVGAEPGVDVSALRDRVEQQTAELPTVTVKDQAEFADEQRAPIDQLLVLVYALLGLALVIAVLGIVNTLALSVVERTREVGLLRAIGLGRRQLRAVFRLEAVSIAVVGTLLGVALGVVFGVALVDALRSEGLEVLVVPGVQLVGFVLASAAVGVLAAVLPARRAARLDVLRAIATE
jgi:putative ABC transport system permease protein